MATQSGHEVRGCSHAAGHQHEHGTRQAYLADRCRCAGCTAANRDAENQRRRDVAYGRPGRRVDADPARRHVHELADAGIGINQTAALSGVPRATLGRLLWGEPRRGLKPTQRLARDTAARILAVQVRADNFAGGTLTDATGTRRRLQALIAIGWTLSAVARELNWEPGRLRRSMNSRSVTRRTADAVASLYERLNLTSPDTSTPHRVHATSVARARARSAGWSPPLAWDDIDTDPRLSTRASTTPCIDDLDIDIAIERLLRGQPVALTLAERDALIDRLTQRGHSLQQISRYFDVSSRTISRRRRAISAA